MSINRREFIKVCQALGLSLPLHSVLDANAGELTGEENLVGFVIVIGAGAGGLATGYLLQQQGIAVTILEASSRHGGRMKRTTEFADFPIPLGAEWIHVAPDILDEIVNDETASIDIETTRYDPERDYGLYRGERISIYDADFSEDSKFIGATWFDFFDDYIVPSIESRIIYNAEVNEVDYSAN